MDNESVFKALSCSTRIKILKILIKKEIHISGLAKEIGISSPVILRHVRILENANLIKKRIIGNVHILSANISSIENVFDSFSQKSSIEIKNNETLFDAIKQLPGIEIKKVGKNQYITSVDGEEGYFIYEVNGKYPKVPIDKYKPEKNVIFKLLKLVPINKKNIDIKIKK